MGRTRLEKKNDRQRGNEIRDRSDDRHGDDDDRRGRSRSRVVHPPTDEGRPRSVVGNRNGPPPSPSASRASVPRGTEAHEAAATSAPPFDQAAFLASLKQTIADEVM